MSLKVVDEGGGGGQYIPRARGLGFVCPKIAYIGREEGQKRQEQLKAECLDCVS